MVGFLILVGAAFFLAAFTATFSAFGQGGSDLQLILGAIYFVGATIAMVGATLLEVLKKKP